MKKYLLLIIFLFPLTSSAFTLGDNIVQNPNFEDECDDSLPCEWLVMPQNDNVCWTFDFMGGGANCTYNTVPEQSEWQAILAQPLSDFGDYEYGSTYRISFEINDWNEGGTISAVFSNQQCPEGMDSDGIECFFEDGDIVYYVTINTYTDYIYLYFQGRGDWSAVLTNVSVQKVIEDGVVDDTDQSIQTETYATVLFVSALALMLYTIVYTIRRFVSPNKKYGRGRP